MRKCLLFLVLLSLIFSCIPNKKLIYFQGNPQENRDFYKIRNSPYRLQRGDNIIINVKSDNIDLVDIFLKSNSSSQLPLLSSPSSPNKELVYSIDKEGFIRMPILGEINVLGLTIKEVRSKIEEKLHPYFKEDDIYFVTVRLDGIKYTVIGEINEPGPKVVYQNQLSILDAISNSGDIPITGNKKNVEVLRITPEGIKKISIDLTSINAINSEIFYIKNNDYINILPLKNKTLGTTNGLSSLSNIISIISLMVTTTVFILSR